MYTVQQLVVVSTNYTTVKFRPGEYSQWKKRRFVVFKHGKWRFALTLHFVLTRLKMLEVPHKHTSHITNTSFTGCPNFNDENEETAP